jgi:hypothetical protein
MDDTPKDIITLAPCEQAWNWGRWLADIARAIDDNPLVRTTRRPVSWIGAAMRPRTAARGPRLR